jgi:RNA polymerase sigma-70 factor (ECF subfamily)
MAPVTDGALWQQVRGGEATALGELYERHACSMHSYCLWRLAAKQLAEEVTAASFLEAWRRRRRLELTSESAAPLLLGVATRVLRNPWRCQRRHARALARIAKADLSPWDEGEAVARVDAMSQLREAGESIRALPPREREALALLAWGGLSHAETAAALGISAQALHSRVARSRSRLRGLAAGTAMVDSALLLPDDAVLASRRPVLERCCGNRRLCST